MTTVPLHRATNRSFKRYKTTSNLRKRHHAGVTSIPVHTDILMYVMFGTLFACWVMIYALLFSMQSIPAVHVPQPTLHDIVKQSSYNFGKLTDLDPSILQQLMGK